MVKGQEGWKIQSALPEVKGAIPMGICGECDISTMHKCEFESGHGKVISGSCFFKVPCSKQWKFLTSTTAEGCFKASSIYWCMIFPQSEVKSSQLKISHVFVFSL